MESVLTNKGQVTVPKMIREHLKLKPVGRIKFFVHPDGTVVILPTISASALRGVAWSRRRLQARPATLKEMDQAAANASARSFESGKP